MTRKGSASSSSSSAPTSASRYGSLSRSRNGDAATFGEALPGMLSAAIDSVISEGDLLSISRTSDGGAICIYIKSGAEIFKTYAVTQEDLDTLLQQLAEGT